jgi:predicted metal-dependent hydrolase
MEQAFERGVEFLRTGRYFEAHEELETAWRAAQPVERDFFQGLVHVAVAWYQAGRGRRIGCERQLAKAARRLAPYLPAHRGVDVAGLLAQVDAAAARVAAGRLDLDPVEPDLLQHAIDCDVEPPRPIEEEE